MLAIYLTMPRRTEKREHYVDWLGAGVLALGAIALLLGLVWGGEQYAWTSPQVVGALATSALLLSVFAWIESRVPEPILPFDLMRSSSTVRASVLSMGLVGFAMFGTIVYVPLFVQGVIGTFATSSGVVLTPSCRRGDSELLLRTVGLPQRPLQAERGRGTDSARHRTAAALADGRAHDERRGASGT